MFYPSQVHVSAMRINNLMYPLRFDTMKVRDVKLAAEDNERVGLEHQTQNRLVSTRPLTVLLLFLDVISICDSNFS